MKVLFISKGGDSLGLAQRVQKEGHSVSFLITDKKAERVGEGMVDKTNFTLPLINNTGNPVKSSVSQLLSKVSPDLVVFDMVKLGKLADLVKLTVPVLGACRWADTAELDRGYGYELMRQVGISVPETEGFKSGEYEKAIKFVTKNKDKRYVYKPSGNIDTSHTYVSQGHEDMIAMLELWKSDKCEFELQEFVEGVEVSCELWWNGLTSSIHNVTFEEKKFMNNNVGPTVGCAGNVVKMVSSKSRIVREGIGKMERLLKKTKYRGPIDLNMIATKNRLYGLEFTVRFGYDALQSLFELHKGSVTELLYNISTGGREHGSFSHDYSISIRLSIPPYPNEGDGVKGVPVGGVNSENERHIWWGDVRREEGKYVSVGFCGALLAVVARGREVSECKRRAYRTVNNLVIPQVQYRTDIGERVEKDEKKLKEWNYL